MIKFGAQLHCALFVLVRDAANEIIERNTEDSVARQLTYITKSLKKLKLFC